MAASIALPPARRISTPARAACGLAAATMNSAACAPGRTNSRQRTRRRGEVTASGRTRIDASMTHPVRIEHDLIGDRQVPAEAYYGIHTLRALENFPITGTSISIYP